VEDEEGKLLAYGLGTFMILPGKRLLESFPPNFLPTVKSEGWIPISNQSVHQEAGQEMR